MFYGGVTNVWNVRVVHAALHHPRDAIVAVDATIMQWLA